MKRYQILMLALPVVFGLGCDAKDILGTCDDPMIGAKVKAVSTASEQLVTVATEIKADVFAACNGIATDLGEPAIVAASASGPTDDEIEMACALASGQIDAAITAGATFELVYTPARCEINASAQLTCEADCDVSGECTPGTVDVRCDPGELSVQCEGSCMAMAYCEADVAIACEGHCEGTCEGACEGSCSGTAECTGTCEGTCDGTCMGGTMTDGHCSGNCMGTCEGTCSVSTSCNGSCTASCSGSCTGSCQLTADAMCDASASCRGGCDGTFTAPKCEGELTPPMCDVDVDCQAGCEGQASFEATCTEPELMVVAEAGVSAELTTTLQTHLPTLLAIIAKGELVLNAASDVASATGRVVTAAAGIPACIAEFGADAAASVTASAEASLSVSVSVMASASVSGSASGGQ